MSLKVVHLADTPLAGAPIRIVKALRRHTDVDARLVVHNAGAYGPRTFDNDLSWQTDREEAMELLAACDVVHLHNMPGLVQGRFDDFDVRPLLKAGRGVLRHLHAEPTAVTDSPALVRTLIDDPLPQLVVAQYQERFYPRARVVPNVIPLAEESYTPEENGSGPTTIFFAPTYKAPAWSDRWLTKGFPETVEMLRRVSASHDGLEVDVAWRVPHDECLKRRRASHITIDEMVTGGFHLSSLEGLAMGLPTFAFLDGRTQRMLAELTGTATLPWMSFRLEDAEPALGRLISDRRLREQIGRRSRRWMERYWNDADLVRHYVDAYTDALEHPDRLRRPRFDAGDRAAMWFMQGADDAVWQARRRRHPAADSELS